MAKSSIPAYESFGKELKRIRTAAKRSLDDVSQAVELDPSDFSQLETGHLRPSQEIVTLLINHFDLAVSTASRLWRLAGYDQQLSFVADDSNQAADDSDDGLEAVLSAEGRQAFLTISDNRAIYTDMFNIRANSYGVTVNFLQGFSQDNPMSVARVGMSLEHAARLAKALGETIGRVTRPPVDQSVADDQADSTPQASKDASEKQ